jgi:hypothetical protein
VEGAPPSPLPVSGERERSMGRKREDASFFFYGGEEIDYILGTAQ